MIDVEFEDVRRELENLLISFLHKELVKMVEEILAEAKKNLWESDAVVTRRLIDSDYMKVNYEELEIEFGFDCPYAGFVEFGTAPRMKLPPVEEIKKWAKLKFGLTEEEAWAVAWVVAKKIKERGTEPNPFFRSALDKVLKYGTD